jgi:hypothetical protein
MRKVVEAAIGAALLLGTGTAELAMAQQEPADQVRGDMLAVVAQREQIDQEMGDLPGAVVSAPPEGVLGIQARRDNLPDKVRLDMYAVIGQRADMDRGRAEAPR